MLGFNVPFGVAVPWMMAVFWFALTMAHIILHYKESPKGVTGLVAIVMLGLLLVTSLWCRIAYTHRKLYEYIEKRNVQKDQSASELHEDS